MGNTHLHFKQLRRRCERMYGWEKEFAESAIFQYGRFILLKVVYKDFTPRLLSPSPTIDKVWHAHILEQPGYAVFCKNLGVELIGHDPDAETETVAKAKRGRTLLAQYEKVFGEAACAEIWDFGTGVDESDESDTDILAPQPKRMKLEMKGEDVF